jgi:hypothetical protein
MRLRVAMVWLAAGTAVLGLITACEKEPVHAEAPQQQASVVPPGLTGGGQSSDWAKPLPTVENPQPLQLPPEAQAQAAPAPAQAAPAPAVAAGN